MNKTKKSLLMSAISLLLCISMLIGSTFAWFTDSVSSAGNKIQSGTLKVDLELLDKETGKWNSLKESQAPIFNYDKWEPGYIDTKVLKVENEGNLALKWVAKFYSEYQLSILADVIDVYVRPSASEIGYPTDRSLEGYTCVGNLRTFINSIEETTWGTLEAKEASYLGIALKMREEAGNEYQGLSLGGAFDIRIYATQYTSESDSFNNQYDKNATFEDLANTSILATATKTLAAGANSLDFDLSYNGLKIAKVIVPASAIANKVEPVTVTFDGINPSQAAIVDDNTKAYAYDIDVTNLKDNLSGNQLITVVVTAPNALAAMKAYHNGTQIQDAVYDEVEGTITFKTANFSPYDFTYQEKQAATLEELRAAVKESNVEIKLTEDLDINLEAGSADRSEDHKAKSTDGKTMWYNAVNIVGKNVAIDLNGHKITVKCSNAHDGNQDVGALFFVDKEGSLNIIDRKGGGFIKMASSIYAVWAPFESPSYVDIYGGAFIGDSYAGDPIGTPVDSNGNYDPANGTMKNENSNRALIYAGFGGNMNVYGGYFLYNNTPNDTKDRNNGAFNAKDFYSEEKAAEKGPLLTIHDGVYMINKEYRQNPANTSQPHGDYDNFSVVLAKYCEVVENVSHSVTIDGKTYNTWCRVTEKKPVSLTVTGYKEAFSKGDIFARGDEFTAIALLSDGTTMDVTDKVTTSGFDASEVGVNTITVTYTSEGESISTTYMVRVIAPVKMTVEPKQSLYNAGEQLKTSGFKVTVYDSTGVATTLSDFTISVDGNINTAGHVNVTVSKDGMSATCTILMWNMTKLEGNKMHTMYYSVPVLFNVSGWSNHTLGQTYVGLAGQTKTIPGTGEVVSDITYNCNIKQDSSSPTGYVYTLGNEGNLTVKNASRYTTLGIEYWMSYNAQATAVGYYFDGDMSTLQFAGPAYDIAKTNEYYQFLGENGFRTNYLTCDLYDFEPGSAHTVHWVAIFNDGIQTFAEWSVTMKEENNDDDAYERDPSKTDVNVIILAGQSNAAGSAPITDDIRAKYGDKKFSNVFINYNVSEAVGNTVNTYFTNGDNFDMYKLGIGGFGANYFGPELGLADYLSTNAPGESWYIIKYAPSGSELDRQWFGDAKLADRMIGYVQSKINILAKDYNVNLAGFVWMQGESDALGSDMAGNYSNNEQKLMTLVRNEFAAYAKRNSTALSTPGSGIVFVDAGIADSGVWPYHATVNTAKKENCAWIYDPAVGGFTSKAYNIANSIFVDTSTLISKNQAYIAGQDDYGNEQDNNDQAHYNDESMLNLGTWFGNALQSMIVNCP